MFFTAFLVSRLGRWRAPVHILSIPRSIFQLMYVSVWLYGLFFSRLRNIPQPHLQYQSVTPPTIMPSLNGVDREQQHQAWNLSTSIHHSSILIMLFTSLLFIWSIVFANCSLVNHEHLFPSYPPPDSQDFHPTPPHVRHPIPSLYHTRYSEQTFIGTHDAAAIRMKENGWTLSGNQYYNISTQLASGVRLLQAQGHRDPNGSDQFRLCHFNCALMDGGSLNE
jgi:hypothetical protein